MTSCRELDNTRSALSAASAFAIATAGANEGTPNKEKYRRLSLASAGMWEGVRPSTGSAQLQASRPSPGNCPPRPSVQGLLLRTLAGTDPPPQPSTRQPRQRPGLPSPGA